MLDCSIEYSSVVKYSFLFTYERSISRVSYFNYINIELYSLLFSLIRTTLSRFSFSKASTLPIRTFLWLKSIIGSNKIWGVLVRRHFEYTAVRDRYQQCERAVNRAIKQHLSTAATRATCRWWISVSYEHRPGQLRAAIVYRRLRRCAPKQLIWCWPCWSIISVERRPPVNQKFISLHE